jgi:hypothetical protein
MDNSISNTSLIPTSLPACINKGGKLNTELYFLYRQGQQMQASLEELDQLLDVIIPSSDDKDNHGIKKEQNRTRECFRRNLNRGRKNEGEIVVVTPRDSSWYTMYVVAPNISSDKFRERFCR